MGFKYQILGVIFFVVAFFGQNIFAFSRPPKGEETAPRLEIESNNTIKNGTNIKGVKSVPKKQKPLFCPKASELIKNDTKWVTKDGKWTHYTSSSADKILGFQGSQWIGVKIGKIICLYKTDEAVPFPIALEYTNVQKILEPKNGGWSALVGNRKFCKSVTVVDCPYFVEAPEDIKNVYEEIKYNPVGEH